MVEIQEEVNADEIWQNGYEQARKEYKEQYDNLQQQQLNIYKIDASKFLMRFRNVLQGKIETYDKNGFMTLEKIHEPIIPKEVESTIMQFLTTHIDQNTFLAFLREEQPGIFCKHIARLLGAELLREHRKRLTHGQIKSIVAMVTNSIFNAYTRAIAGRENRLISTSLTHVEHQTFMPKKKGIKDTIRGMIPGS